MIKALPVRLVYSEGYFPCATEDATHVKLNFPGPSGLMVLPVILNGRREGTGCWTWNASMECPTLRPSVLIKGHNFRCHSWVNDGKVQFLGDSTHEFVGQTMELLEVKSEQ